MFTRFLLFIAIFSGTLLQAQDKPSTNSLKQVTAVNKASVLMGMAVKNEKDEHLAEMKDMAVDLSSRRVVYAILAAGGFLGVGEKLLAIPPMSLETGSDEKSLLLKADKEALRSAPSFARDEWNRIRDAEFADKVYAFYQETAPLAGVEIREAAGADSTNTDKATGQSAEPAVATAALLRASELIGKPVNNHKGEKLGDIRDFAVDLHSGELLYAVLSAGGFLGVGNKMFAVPTQAFQRAPNNAGLILAVDREFLKEAASFDAGNWPAKADDRFATKTYKYHGQSSSIGPGKPVYESAGARKDAGFDGDVSAEDQSNAKQDVAMTARLRRFVVQHDEFSFAAKNIIIVTKQGRITLKGGVRNARERETILQWAREIAGPGNVHDQLRVMDSH